MNKVMKRSSCLVLALLFTNISSKVLFNKDLNINGQLTANSATFSQLHVEKAVDIDDLLSADSIKSDILDTKEIYVDVIKPQLSQTVIVKGNLIIEDPDEEP